MDLYFYRLWYQNEVKDNLSKEEKRNIMRNISKMSLKTPLYLPGIEIEKREISELAKYTKLEKYSGRQLMVVLSEISNELRGK